MLLSDTAERECWILWVPRSVPSSSTGVKDVADRNRMCQNTDVSKWNGWNGFDAKDSMYVSVWSVKWWKNITYEHNYCEKALIGELTKSKQTEGFQCRSKEEESKQEFRVQETGQIISNQVKWGGLLSDFLVFLASVNTKGDHKLPLCTAQNIKTPKSQISVKEMFFVKLIAECNSRAEYCKNEMCAELINPLSSGIRIKTRSQADSTSAICSLPFLARWGVWSPCTFLQHVGLLLSRENNLCWVLLPK